MMGITARWIIFALCIGSAAHAQRGRAELDPPEAQIPDLRIAITNLLVARYNPLGLEDDLRIGPQQLLYRSPSRALRDNFLFFGFAARVSPASIKAGPSLELQPLSIFNLRVSAELVGWFGSFNDLQSFTSPRADYSDTTLAHTHGQYRTAGAHVFIEPLLQMKFGPIVLRNHLSIDYWRMSVHAGDTVFYEPTLDTLVSANGWVLSNDLDALYLDTRRRFAVGVRYSVVEPLYVSSDYAPGDPHKNDNGHQRLGPLAAYTFFDHGYTRFNKPSLILIVNWYVDHRYRTGADVNAGIPYLVLAFAFTSDLHL
jgi:hypothetical protein